MLAQIIMRRPDDYVMPCYIDLGYPAKDAPKPAQKSVYARNK